MRGSAGRAGGHRQAVRPGARAAHKRSRRRLAACVFDLHARVGLADREHLAARCDDAAGCHHIVRVGGRHGAEVHGAGGGGVEGIDPASVRLDVGDPVLADPHESRHLVGDAPALQLVQARQLIRTGRDDQLAAALGGDSTLIAEVVELPRALDAKARFERARRVIDARVDDPGGAAGLVRPDLRLALQDGDSDAVVAKR